MSHIKRSGIGEWEDVGKAISAMKKAILTMQKGILKMGKDGQGLSTRTCKCCGAEWPVNTVMCPLCDYRFADDPEPAEGVEPTSIEQTNGRKDDQGKLRYDLIPAWPLEQLAAVMTYGAKTYGDHNWRKGLKYSQLYAAAQRHLNAFWQGDDIDEDSGLPHLAHAAANMLMLLEYDHRHYDELGFDDSIYDVYSAEDIRAMIREGIL